jgi:hypothetical protein
LSEKSRLRVFENRVLRGIFGSKRDELTGEWRKIHKKELYDLYSLKIFRLIKSRRMRWAGLVARMGKGKAYTGFWWRKLMERDYLEETRVDGRIILRRIFRKWDVELWTGSRWLRIGTSGGYL